MDELVLTTENFLDMSNQQIFKAMQSIKRKGFPIDGASLKDEIGETGFMFLGGNPRLAELKSAVASIHAFKSYEQIIINQWKVHTTREKMTEALNDDLTVEKVQALIKDLSKVDEEGTQEDMDIKPYLTELYDDFMVETPKKRSGVPSGYVDIDTKTDGFRPGNLIIIGARPSMGKTAFSLNLAINAAKKGNAIPIYFSLEMLNKELLKRMISCLGEINGLKMKNPYHYTNDDEKDRGVKALGEIDKLHIKLSEKPRQKVAEMRAKVRKIKQEYPDKEVIVIIDYLTLIKPSQDYKGNAHSQITEISADLKTMAKDFNCPVVCLAQLSRGVESRDNKRPRMSDLRESGSIEQDADIIMMLYRDEYYNPTTDENRNILEVDITKNRDGEAGLVKLLYKKEINKIENLYHYHKAKQ